MEFTKVKTTDWVGNAGIFKIIRLVKRDNGKFSCTFKNSIGDHETFLADETDLIN